MNKYIIGLFLFGAAWSAVAGDDYGKTVGRIGVQGNTAYFSLKEGLNTNCRYGIVYIDITTDFGRLAYANILSSKATSSKLSWVGYTQTTSGGQCILSTAEIAE